MHRYCDFKFKRERPSDPWATALCIQSNRHRRYKTRRIAPAYLFGMAPALLLALLLGACKNEPISTPSSRPRTSARVDAPPARELATMAPATASRSQEARIRAGHPGLTRPVMAGGPSPAAGAVTPPPTLSSSKTVLDGVTLTVPEGWQAQACKSNLKLPGLAPKAVYCLATGDMERERVMVRITHFPNMRTMRNMVQANLNRWFRMFSQPDGRPTSETAVVNTFEAGPCRITVADIRGSVGPQTDQGMIGAIIEHPNGPFFLKAMGPAAGIERWKPSILAYLRSAAPNE